MIFLLSFLLSFSVFAKVQGFIHLKQDRLPLEFVLLTDSLNEMKFSQEEKDALVEHLKNFNRNLKFIPKEQSFFLIKSEIYKNMLEKEFHGDFKIMKFTNIDLTNIEKSYQAGKKDYSPFARWLVESVLSDFTELKNYPGFNMVKLDVPEKDPTLNLVRRKLSLLSPWLGALAGLKAPDFNGRLKKIMLETVIDLDLAAGIYRNLGSSKELDPEDLITTQTITTKKLPVKETEEVVTPAPEQNKAPSLEEESELEKEKAEKLTDGLSAPEVSPVPTAETPKGTAPVWKPEEEKSKSGKTLPPPAPSWTPES